MDQPKIKEQPSDIKVLIVLKILNVITNILNPKICYTVYSWIKNDIEMIKITNK